MESSLSEYQVLDLTDEKGYFCGKILGDLGANVIKIERPGGDIGRMNSPFYKNDCHPEKSLFWLTFNTSKRGITLNIETTDGREIFLKLLMKSDFVIESFPPGYLNRLGLNYEEMSRINPRLILVSIAPFGQKGPYSNFKTSDLVSMAMGGLLFITGYPDRPPVRIGVPQAYLLAASHGAAGAMIAHYYRERSGTGQQVDVSIQEAVTRALFMEPLFWDIEKFVIHRDGHYIKRYNLRQRELWECKDGLVFFRIFGGATGRRNKGLVEWIKEVGGSAGILESVDWDSLNLSRVSQEEYDTWEEGIEQFFKKQTVEKIKVEALKRNIIALFPCHTCKEIMKDEQLAQRNYWVDIEYPYLGTRIRYPGAPCKMSLTPWRVRPAPRIGEHNQEVYIHELGMSEAEYTELVQKGII
ncbi:MAG: CoA transferase [Thermodesulfobacteriota bacterium]